MTAPSGRSPYFDFQSQAKSPDIGFAASEGEAFAFAPLPRRFLKFRFYECASHFFVFGSDSASKFSLLEILRDEGQIEEQSVVTVPALADDIRFASCKGTAVEQVAPGRWRVQMTLKNGGLETIETSNLIFEGVVKWSVQELEGVEAYTACLKELQERFRASAWLEHEHFDGIVGFARFTDQWYLIGTSKKEAAARVCCCDVFRIGTTFMIPFNASKATSQTEQRYQSLFKNVFDKSRGFYFSYDYDVSRTLQSNMGGLPRPIVGEKQHGSLAHTFDEKFIWNLHLLRDLPEAMMPWCIFIIQGFVEQRRIAVGFCRTVSIALLARRSRHFAGTRYNKRGQDMHGRCANEVEVEQIVMDESAGASLGGHVYTSFVQLRASIPLFWNQPSEGLNPKPPVTLAYSDPLYNATALHFSQLMQRYGSPIYVLNLVKRHEKIPRESLLSEEFCAAVQVLNAGITDKEHVIRYIHFDFTQESRVHSDTDSYIDRLIKLTSQTVDHVGIFHAGSNRWANPELNGVPVAMCMQQRGVLRSNCIDCLDRTNAAQYFAGQRALTLQFQALGLTNSEVPSSCLINEDILCGLYINLGNQLAIQYVGSSAHDKTGAGHVASGGRMRAVNKIFVAAQRYISNTFTDQEKQQAIDVFLGTFCPSTAALPIWQLEDRSFVWSSSKNYEFCSLRPNKPCEGWWRQPLRCFKDGVQMGFAAAVRASGPSLRSNAKSVLTEPFAFSPAVTAKGRAAVAPVVSRNKAVWLHAEDASDDYDHSDSVDDDYSTEGWGFGTTNCKPNSERRTPVPDGAGSVHSQTQLSAQRTFHASQSADVALAAVARPSLESDPERLHKNPFIAHKDTPNFKQLRESINYDFAHDWKRFYRGKSYEELASDVVEDMPRLRIDGDGKRSNTTSASQKMKLLFSVSQVSQAVHVTSQPLYPGLRASFARATLLEEFSDTLTRDWTAGNDPFIMNDATEEDMTMAENGFGHVNSVILRHSKPREYAFRDIQLINPPKRALPADVQVTPSRSLVQSMSEVPLDYILQPSSVVHEIEQLSNVSGDWEMRGHTTRAGVGVKVDVFEDDQGSCSRVIIMSLQFKANSDLQEGDEIRSINGLRMDLFITSCLIKSWDTSKIAAEVQNLFMGCAGSWVTLSLARNGKQIGHTCVIRDFYY